MRPTILSVLRHQLEQLQQRQWSPYTVPGLWVAAEEPSVFSSPPSYHLRQLDEIERLAGVRHAFQSKPHTGLMYNALVRHVVAYDHGPRADEEGWCRTGTLLKLLSLLPYLHRSGVESIVLLPLFERGRKGRKGNLGSPYAVRHPFRIDHQLVEPALGLSADDVLHALVAAAHVLGMKVVLEVVLRTASIDSDLVYSHPEWFYWITESASASETFRKPAFTKESINEAESRISQGLCKGLPAPDAAYQEQFMSAPHHVAMDEQGWLGLMADGRRVRIPGAFADWPPDDPQPPWGDVTYLRMHDHPDYRYMAYNTIRYYEDELDRPEYRMGSLWNLIASILPHWIRLYQIDGAMIDMGHALPRDLQRRVIAEARALHPEFLLLEENFVIGHESVAAGYDAVVGYMPLHLHEPEAVRAFVTRAERKDLPVKYLATPETHNTPRSASRPGGHAFAIAMWTFMRCLPRSVAYLHAGMELGETTPVNTGLGFTRDEQKRWTTDLLPLFSQAYLPWDAAGPYVEAFKRVEGSMTSSHWFAELQDDDDVTMLETEDVTVVAFARGHARRRTGVIVVVNIADDAKDVSLTVTDGDSRLFVAPMEGVSRHAGHQIRVHLRAWSCIVLPTWRGGDVRR